MMSPLLRRFLEANRVRYSQHIHPARPTAAETAAVAHVPPRRFAKTVLVRRSGPADQFVLALLPADELVDLHRLGTALGQPVELATEAEFARLFPDFEVGAAPPLGFSPTLAAEVTIIVDACLAANDTIIFNAGTHTDAVELAWQDFARLAHPRIVDYGRPRETGVPAGLWP